MVGGKTFALVSDPILYRTDHRGFFSGYSGFPFPLKTVIVTALEISQIQAISFLALKIANATVLSNVCRVRVQVGAIRLTGSN